MNPKVRFGGAVLLALWFTVLLEDSVGSRSSLPLELLQHLHPGELPKPPLCLFVISAFNGLIRQALTLVLHHIPALGAAGQAPLTPLRPLISPSPRQNTCPPNSFWEFDAVRQQVRCFVQPCYHCTRPHIHLPITPHLRVPAHPPPISQDAVCRQRPWSLLCKQKCALINGREVLSWEQ